MSKKFIGVTVNGIEEECKWDKPGVCPRHTIHKGQHINQSVIESLSLDDTDFINPMSVFDEAYDENLEITGDGFTIDEPETLQDLGKPEANIITVYPSNGYAMVEIQTPEAIITIDSKFLLEANNHYMSLNQLKSILDNN